MIAHAGGFDEFILGIGVVLLFLLFRSSRAERRTDEPDEGPCLYCSHDLGPGVERCPECGFRALRGQLSSSTSDAER